MCAGESVRAHTTLKSQAKVAQKKWEQSEFRWVFFFALLAIDELQSVACKWANYSERSRKWDHWDSSLCKPIKRQEKEKLLYVWPCAAHVIFSAKSKRFVKILHKRQYFKGFCFGLHQSINQCFRLKYFIYLLPHW